MSGQKKVQATLSSFFKTKTEKPTRANKRTHKEPKADANSTQDPLPTTKRRRANPAATSHRTANGGPADKTLKKTVSDTSDIASRLRSRMQARGTNTASGVIATNTGGSSLHALETTRMQLVERTPGIKYTPLEEQVLGIKERHPDMLLAVEVGYKFRFFGEDARIASRVLGIMCTTANNFYNASVPTPRLAVHTRRLVQAGYKVGVVRQGESAALKAAGDNKSAPFVRALAEVLTASTMVDEVGSEDGAARFLVCVAEAPQEGCDHRVNIGLLAVQATTGHVVYDCFEDSYLRSELGTRLAHLEPAELLVHEGLSRESIKVLSEYCGYKLDFGMRKEPLLEDAERSGVRVALSESHVQTHAAAVQAATQFYTDNDAADALASVLEFPKLVLVALTWTIEYLQPFGLARALFQHADAFNPFRTRAHMLLSATALHSLAVFTSGEPHNGASLDSLLRPGSRLGGTHSAYIGDGTGSLFDAMDHTVSQFGRRMLRRWVARPLVSKRELDARIQAVACIRNALVANDDTEISQLAVRARGILGRLVDLERGLCRIQYQQASPAELLRVLRSLNSALSILPSGTSVTDPPLLAEILGPDVWTAELRTAIPQWMHELNTASAKSGDLKTLFASGILAARLNTHKERIAHTSTALGECARDAGAQLATRDFTIKSVSGIDYLIEIRTTKASCIPRDWIKISSTKTHSRFHTRAITEKLAERERYREELHWAAKDAYREFLDSIGAKYQALRQLVQSLATLDALLSLAQLSLRAGYTQPNVTQPNDDGARIELISAVHPVLSRINPQYVANDVTLGDARAALLTGPNMGGKSSLVRTVALICIMAQCGSYVPAKHARLTLIDAIFTRMGAGDNMMAGESTFMVEMRETAHTMRFATANSLVIIDELGRGTSTFDGAAIAHAVLDYLVAARPLTLFITHYAHLVAEFAANAAVESYHMGFLESARADDGIAEITFLYSLERGASLDSYGLNVARMAGLPRELLECARDRAGWMKLEFDSVCARRQARALRDAVRVAMAAGDEAASRCSDRDCEASSVRTDHGDQ